MRPTSTALLLACALLLARFGHERRAAPALAAAARSGEEGNGARLQSSDATEFQQTHWDSRVIRQLIAERFEGGMHGKADDGAVNVHDLRTRRILALRAQDNNVTRVRTEFRNVVQGVAAATAADENGRTLCPTDECKYGKCVFAGCSNPVSCSGGRCVFVDCEAPTCDGGLCRFYGCHRPTCKGGGCRFEETNTTLGHGFCTGGECSIDGVPTASNMRNWLAR
jgi:hypothetical protein